MSLATPSIAPGARAALRPAPQRALWRPAPRCPRARSSPLPFPPRPLPRPAHASAVESMLATASMDEGEGPSVDLDNEAAPGQTVLRVTGRRDAASLARVAQVLADQGMSIRSAAIGSQGGGDVYHLTTRAGGAVAADAWPPLRDALLRVLLHTTRSSKPSIHGAAVDVDARALKAVASEADAAALESAAREMAAAAEALVGVEREIIAAGDEVSTNDLLAKQSQRYEASALLERRMAAMEAILTSRRELLERALQSSVAVPDFVKPQTVQTTGPAAGNGYEIILQAFNWESCKEAWWKKMAALAPRAAEVGFTSVWLPPPSDAVSPQGYLPRDLYDLNSKYGSEAELRDCIAVAHEVGLKVIADIVINHRCAHYQGDDGKWNKFGGRLAWDRTAICSNNPAYGGKGAWKKTDDYPAAPNLDHTNERVHKGLIEWMNYLRNSIGFDGWRFDYVKGYEGRFVRDYVDATVPQMAFGEYWDTCSYTDGVLNYNQDAHRQRTVDWCDATGATAAAFDFTLKGILQEAVTRREYWRLIDSRGRPPGVLGIWPSRAITFLENHDTGSTLQHWPFPWEHAAQGYAYLLTHCGTPCVFYDHMYYDVELREHITKLIAIRKRFRINNKSEVKIHKAYGDLYSAIIDKKVAMKIGPGDWSPTSDKVDVGQKEWKLLHSGPNFAVWEAVL
ncbi:AMA2 [Auxenochlorella protothecoides x Auxenochlorella symbiontica]